MESNVNFSVRKQAAEKGEEMTVEQLLKTTLKLWAEGAVELSSKVVFTKGRTDVFSIEADMDTKRLMIRRFNESD